LLRRPVSEVDLVVDADAAAFAQELAAALGASVRRHERFGTASMSLPGGEQVDIATRRRERYARPGALPEVEPGTLVEDLARRDFSVNAMALDLLSRPPKRIDPLGGARDLAARRLRLLHRDSATDDPTRGFRAARYGSRLGFRIEPRSARWIREAASAGALATISGDRIRRELEKIFAEPRAGRAIASLERLGLLRALHPSLSADEPARRRVDAAALIAANRGAPLFPSVLLAWISTLSPRSVAGIAGRLGLTGDAARRLAQFPGRRRALRLALERRAPSRIDAWLGQARPEEVTAALAGLSPGDRRRVMRAQRLRATMKPGVSGGEIVAAGVPPGPWIARALAAARAARLDGRITAGEEKDYAIATARRRSSGRR
jgi:tRNA nucleotidyltransferase (CCA-adding enzyme)